MGNGFAGHPERIFGPTNYILRESLSLEFFEKDFFTVEISTPVEISASEVHCIDFQKIDFFKSDQFSHFELKNANFCSKIIKNYFFSNFSNFSFSK